MRKVPGLPVACWKLGPLKHAHCLSRPGHGGQLVCQVDRHPISGRSGHFLGCVRNHRTTGDSEGHLGISRSQ